MKPLRQTKFPIERVLTVKEQSIAYRGFATSLVLGGHDILVLARTMDNLRDAVTDYAQGRDLGAFVPEACHPVVVLAQRNVTLDDEL